MNCEFCNRLCKNQNGLSIHKRYCKNNPGRVIISKIGNFTKLEKIVTNI